MGGDAGMGARAEEMCWEGRVVDEACVEERMGVICGEGVAGGEVQS